MPKRWKGWAQIDTYGNCLECVEIRPDDPPDLDAFLADCKAFMRDLIEGYDHCSDAHKYENGACRVCNAEAFMMRHFVKEVEHGN